MDKNDLPLGFCFALAQNPTAMRAFSLLPVSRKTEVLQQAHSVSSREEMQALVKDISAQG